jgi:hypothetical protein
MMKLVNKIKPVLWKNIQNSQTYVNTDQET